MGRIIHARRRDGHIVFAEWSTVSDGYTTNHMFEDQMEAYLIGQAVQKVIPEIKERLERARSTGWSAFDTPRLGLDSPWEEKPIPDDEDENEEGD